MPDTTARGIQFPLVGDQITPLEDHFEALATTADTAIDNALSAISPQWRARTNTTGFLHNDSGNWMTVSGGWTAIDGDPGDEVGITYGSGVLTVSEAGLYLAVLTLTFETVVDAGTRGARFLKTGGVPAGARAGWLGRTSATENGIAWFLGALSASDTLTIQAFQSSGMNLNLSNNTVQDNMVAIVRLGASS